MAEREYLKTPVLCLVENVCAKIKAAIPVAFQKNGPKDEPDLQTTKSVPSLMPRKTSSSVSIQQFALASPPRFQIHFVA